jgi:phosphoglycerate dehydrogenase-like enzyme
MADARPIVLVVTDVLSQRLDHLAGLSSALRIEHRRSEEISEALWRDVEVLYTFTTLPAPEQAPKLRWIQLFTAGADHVFRHPIGERPVVVTSVSGVHAVAMAEYVFGMLLAWYHRIPTLLAWQASAEWPPEQERMTRFVPRAELWEQTLGIVGYGSVGRQIARVGQGLGMTVLAVHRSGDTRDRGFILPGAGDPEGRIPARYYRPAALGEMLPHCDVVVLAVPLTPESRGSFGEVALRAMKRQAVFVNVARGGVCDEAALLRALQEQWIGAAILDVFAQEPLPPDSRFWRLPNVLMSPHTSGHSRLYETRAAQVFAENLRRYAAGEPLLNVVDRDLNY